ncbi:alpha/beta fold hydrolase [Rhodococcus rhodnii]|uniref:Alpha/beta fold hydrolase n=1 Tax=Rhodococcus rhodnii TaxID=38312 RepID=A0A6P2CI72_9NOCA|nr:alpha/beta fold hydrolase [Rhodococcus rhodnii]
MPSPVDGVEIAYEASGSGDPLVLLHGSALSRAIWRGLGYVRALRDTHRVVLVDLRGHGRSGKPTAPEAYAMGTVTADVAAVLDALDIARADVFGYSFGGRTALSLATEHPDRVRRLVLGGASSAAQAGSFDRLFFSGCVDVLERSGVEGFLDGWEERRGSEVDAATAAAFRANDAAALAAYMRRMDVEPGIADDALARVTAPTLVLVGSRDHERISDAEHPAATIPDARLTVVDGADHGTMLAHRDEVLDAVAPFLGDPISS